MNQETAALRRPLAFVWRYRRGLGEMLIVFAVMLLYYGTRGMAIGQQDTAIANAHAVIDIESRLGIFREPAINGWVVDHRLAVLVLNWIYTYLHLPVLIAFAIWVYLRRPTQYAAIRNAFLVSAVVGLAMYALYPCAPPRFIPGYGFTDTLADYSAISYEMHSIQLFYNPYAAIPSLHFGWSLLVGIGLCWLGRNAFMRAIGIVLPAVMLIAIIGTANHFFFDAIAGSLVMGFGLLIGFWSRLVDVWNGREVLYDSRQ
ncbi:MAG: phosphatase PAP2 family protein [Thermomicrobiales bacterium]